MPKRRKYSAEFKRQAVELAGSPGVSARQVAQELGINGTMLSRWCREAGTAGEKAFQGQGKARDEELANLRRELARVRKERDFLQEAAAFFAKVSK
jgi:transposase